MTAHVAAPPDVLRWSTRSGDHGDCVVAALELACGVSYEQALQAATKTCPRVLTEGMSWPETVRAAKILGYRARVRRAGRYDVDEATGILHVYQSGGARGWSKRGRETSHAVYLWEGRVIEPKFDRRQLWRHPEQFLKHYGYKAGSLLVLERAGDNDSEGEV